MQLTGHDFLKSLGIALIPATAPDFFSEDTPTAVLVRQVLGPIAPFEKTERLEIARRPPLVSAVGGSLMPRLALRSWRWRRLRARRMSLRKIAAELAARGHITAGGPYVASAVQGMLG